MTSLLSAGTSQSAQVGVLLLENRGSFLNQAFMHSKKRQNFREGFYNSAAAMSEVVFSYP